eukprot:559609-Amphidinium_carterae.2
MEDNNVQIMALGDIRWVKEFSGQDRDFESWSFVMESLVAELGWKNMWDDYRGLPNPLELDRLGRLARAVSENLYLAHSLSAC